MQRDVRRSDPKEAAGSGEPEAATKSGGFARSFFQFGGKRSKRSAVEQAAHQQGRLHERLKDVLERDRAIIAAEPPRPEVVDIGHDQVEMHDDEAWQDPFGEDDPEPNTGTHVRHEDEQGWTESFGEAQTGTRPTERALSQIASWIEEEIGDLDGDGKQALDAPLDPDEAAELDAVLATQDDTLISGDPEFLAQLVAPEAEAEPAPRAAVKAKVSARPARDDDAPASKEPINTLTMARLLAMQGYKPRALAVYRELLKRTPADEALRAEYENLKNQE
jgi:hypothetical protein